MDLCPTVLVGVPAPNTPSMGTGTGTGTDPAQPATPSVRPGGRARVGRTQHEAALTLPAHVLFEE